MNNLVPSEVPIEDQAEALLKFAAIENQAGHMCLAALGRRGDRLAFHYYSNDLYKFHSLVAETWDKLEGQYCVNHVYKLPVKVREDAEDFLGSELLKIYAKANHEYYYSRESRNKFLLAMKLCCYADYGFINEMNKRKEGCDVNN